jgi:chromosome segregation ATPase
MTEQELQPGLDAEKRALNELISRFSADRDGLSEAIARCQARLDELSERLASAPIPAPAAEPTAPAALDAWRAETDRAVALAERNAETLATLAQRTEEAGRAAATVRGDLASGLERIAAQLEDVRTHGEASVRELRTTLEALERRVDGALAPGNVDPDETPWAEDVTNVRAEIIELRESAQRAVGEAQARLGVRVESIVAGVEAQVSRVQDDLWKRLSDLQARLETQAGTIGRLRDEVQAAHRLVDELETALADQANRGVGAFVGRACNEVVAAVLGAASVGVIVGRYAAGAVLPRLAR